MMENIAFPYEHTSERQPSELKKVVVGFLYTFAVEIIFILITIIAIAIIFLPFAQLFSVNHFQSISVSDSHGVKYFDLPVWKAELLTITIGGIKRRVVVKRFCKKYKVFCR